MFLISFFDEKFHHRSFSTDCDVVSEHGCHDMFALDADLSHAWPSDPSRPLEVDASSSFVFCAASRVPYKLYCNSPHICAIRRILFFVMERRSTPFARRPVPQPFLHVHPWRSPTALLSASPAAASTRTTRASRASCILSRATSRARWASLFAPCQPPPILS